MRTIDINCDLGEGRADDEQLMPLISSCNIACGGHYGDEHTMAETIGFAQKHNVAIGAHPSYPDKNNFGRQPLKMAPSALKATLIQQLHSFMEIAEKNNVRVHHVKAHGSLYHDIKNQEEAAGIFTEVITSINPGLIIYTPPGSVLEKYTKGTLETWTEGFGDRKYTTGYELVSRHEKGAVLLQKEQVLKQILSIIKDGKIPIEGAAPLPCNIQTICMHSDTPNCLNTLKYIRKQLPLHGFKIALP